MARFSPSHWTGNKWPSIDIEPVDSRLFLPVLTHLAAAYDFPVPALVDLVEGYAADFVVREVNATLLLDTWTFSLACSSEGVRNDILVSLQALPPDFFLV